MFREGILDEVGGNRSMNKKWKSFLEKLQNKQDCLEDSSIIF